MTHTICPIQIQITHVEICSKSVITIHPKVMHFDQVKVHISRDMVGLRSTHVAFWVTPDEGNGDDPVVLLHSVDLHSAEGLRS